MTQIKILIVEDHKDIRELVAFCLRSRFSAQILEATSGNQAIDLLKKNNDIGCVVSDYRMDDGTGGDLFLYLQSIKSKVPFILCSGDSPEDFPEFLAHKPAGYVHKPMIVKPLQELISQIIKKTGENLLPPPAFCPIKTATVLKANLLESDLYIKLSEDKYVKVFKRGDSFDNEDFKKYTAKDVDYLYLRHEDTSASIEKFVVSLLSREATLEISESAHEAMHEISMQLGFTKEVQELAKANVDLALRTIRKNPNLGALFKRTNFGHENYISSHSIVLAHVACGIAELMTWNSGLTSYKLAMAALMHDISLTDDRLARVQSFDDLLKGKSPPLSVEDIERIKKHPEESAKIIRKFSELPADIDLIVLQHHERPDGSGFPYKLEHSAISPLSSVFIIAHEIVCYFIEHHTDSITPFLDELRRKYSVGHFKKVMAAFERN